MSLICASLFASGFQQPLSTVAPTVVSQLRSSAPVALANEAPTSRRALLRSVAALGAAGTTSPAWAGYISSLGIETTKPENAEKDDELVASKAVQDGLAAIKKYRSAAASLGQQFDADLNMNIIPTIRKEFDFAKLRNSLNVVTTVFDDQTQLTTDRSIRGCAAPPTLPMLASSPPHRPVSCTARTSAIHSGALAYVPVIQLGL